MDALTPQVSTTQVQEIEIAYLDRRYKHTRMHKPGLVFQIANSIERYGQINPVITLKEDPLFVLLDGYLRVSALKRCGKDTVMAEVWQCRETDALARVLMKTQERRWEPLEQALLLRELKDRHKLSQGDIAHLMGRDKSWVSRRLSLIDALPEKTLESVISGHIGIWSATRILAPLARANQDHAKALTDRIRKDHLSTRDLTVFYNHYQKSNKKIREKMVHQPTLFLKALRAKQEDEQAELLKNGPEGKWAKDVKVAGHILRRLMKDAITVIYPGQSNLDRRVLLTAFKETKGLMSSLDKEVRRLDNDNCRDQTDHTDLVSTGNRDQENQHPSKAVQEHNPAGAPGREERGAPECLTLRGDQANDPGVVPTLQG